MDHCPVRVGGQAIGLLQVLSRDPNAFDQRRLELWDEVAQQVALVTSNLQVSFDNRRLSHQQRLVSLVSQAAVTAGSRDEAYRRLAEIGLGLSGVESSTVFLWHEDDGLLEVAHEAVTNGFTPHYRSGERIVPPGSPEQDGVFRVERTGHYCLEDETLPAPERAMLERLRVGRTAIYPLRDESHVYGVLSLKARDTSPFPAETVRLAETIALTATAVVRNIRSREEERRTEREQHALLRLSRVATSYESVEERMGRLEGVDERVLGRRRPVDQVQVQTVDAEAFEAGVECGQCALVSLVGIPQLVVMKTSSRALRTRRPLGRPRLRCRRWRRCRHGGIRLPTRSPRLVPSHPVGSGKRRVRPRGSRYRRSALSREKP